jgi:nucleoside-diphosphate-sugar epimerase
MMSDWDDASILVVGGAGFVGSNLVRRLLKEQVSQVVIVDNLLSSERENIPEDDRILFREGSIAHEEILAGLKDQYDYIFHLATYHGNQSSIHDPLADHENNLITTLRLFHWIRDFKKLKRVVYSGAGCAVAEKTYESPQATREDDPISLNMDSPYSISKIVGEFYAVYFHKQHQLPAVVARFQNVYGPGEVLGAGRWRGTPATVWRNVTPTFIYKALKGESLPLENEGVASRDFIYVEDIVEGLLLCALRGTAGQVYNLASGSETTIKELGELINRLTENKGSLKYLPRRDWDRSGKRFGSTEKSRNQLGFEAKTSLEEGLKKTIDWTRQHFDFIERTMGKHKHLVPLS